MPVYTRVYEIFTLLIFADSFPEAAAKKKNVRTYLYTV